MKQKKLRSSKPATAKEADKIHIQEIKPAWMSSESSQSESNSPVSMKSESGIPVVEYSNARLGHPSTSPRNASADQVDAVEQKCFCVIL